MKTNRDFDKIRGNMQPVQYNPHVEKLMKAIVIAIYLIATLAIIATSGCSKMGSDPEDAPVYLTPPKLILSDLIIQPEKTIIITFDNGNNNSCGLSEIQVSNDHGSNWEIISRVEPKEGLTNVLFSPSSPGLYFFRASWINNGAKACTSNGKEVSFSETQTEVPLVVRIND